MQWLIFLTTGVLAGFLAGLFGIGGGLIIVAALVFAYAMLGFDPEVIAHMAVGTSLATIVLTSISSMHAHHLNGGVNWQIWRLMTPGLLLGSLLGAFVASLMSGLTLQLVIGVAMLLIGLKMLYFTVQAKDVSDPNLLPSKLGLSGLGLLNGSVSSLFGIGGGSLNVPTLAHFGQSMRESVGTSAALGLPIALAGALGFALFGAAKAALLPGGAVGYVYVPAFVSIALMSVVFARFGARFAHAMPQAKLKRAFGWMQVILGLYLMLEALW